MNEVIGTVADMYYDASENAYVPAILELHGVSKVNNGEWYPSQTIVTEQLSEAQQALLTDDITVLLSVAVEFGTVGFAGETVEVKYAGCGKVLASR